VNSKRDQELLCDYAERGSEEAFAELVRRYADFVHSSALRMVGNLDLAREVTQAVFVALSQNARPLSRRAVLSGWLHRTAQNLAAKTVRAEVRRRAREQEAAAMNENAFSEIEPVWERIAPHLDEALGQLKAVDRDVVLLRFFERRSMQEIGHILGLSEAAAQKRVMRGVERLKGIFVARGITASSVLIASALSANSVKAAPLALVKATTAVAIAKGAAASGATLALIKGALKLMAWTKAKTAVLVGTGVLLAAAATTVVVETQNAGKQSALAGATRSGAGATRPKPASRLPELALSRLPGTKAWAQSIVCQNDLRQLGIALKAFGVNHNNQFLFNVSTNSGGTLEWCARGPDGFDRNAYLHFRFMDRSNELAGLPRLLVCPSDSLKTRASDMPNLGSNNISYQLRTGPQINPNNSTGMLAVLLFCPIHHNALRADGSVHELSEPEIKALLGTSTNPPQALGQGGR
jgi:RNA polymerase sigma factor (sigma-70 family)